MSKTLKVVAIAFAFAAAVSTVAAATFNTNLTVGSTGADVSALQSWLISKGFNIAAISSGAATPGYFGAQTKSAVVAYQASVGLPTTGFVGPLTRGILNGSSVPSTGGVVVCPVGYTCTATPGTTPATPGTGMTSGDGSITVSYSPYVTTSQTLKKGDTKDVYSVKLKATSGAVKVNRFDVHFSERPWLIFSQLTLKDSSGTVIATKPLMSSADATEITVGTDYLVRFDNVNYTVDPSKEATLVVGLTVLAASDKVTGQTVNITVPSGSIRTINGLGYTDSLGISNTNTVTLSSTGSAGDLYTRISPNTLVQRAVTTSATQITSNVELGVFSLKLQNQNGTVNSLSLNIRNSTGVATTTLFSNVRLVDGSNTYGANSLAAGSATFTNLSIPLTQDVWKDLKVVADVNSNQTGLSASTTLVAASVSGVDTNFNTITLTNASNATSNDVSFNTSSISVTNLSALSTPIAGGANGNTIGSTVTFKFTVNNTGNSDIFLSKVPATALATSTTGSTGSPASASSTLTYVQANQDVFAGDTGTAPTSGAYVVPAGVSRTFTYTGTLDNTNGTNGNRIFKITQINYGTSAGSPTGQNVSYGLNDLTVIQNLVNQ